MVVHDTEKRIIQVVCEHYLSGATQRLTINAVCERVGISRQAFHKSYLHLKPYINGLKDIDELLLGSGGEADKTILQCQKLIRELRHQLSIVKDSHEKELKSVENDFVTTLMNGDVLIHRSRELTNELKKKALHNEILKRQLVEKEIELLRVDSEKRNSRVSLAEELHVMKLQVDLGKALANFSINGNVDEYYNIKSQSVARVKDKLGRVLKSGIVRVVLFQDRFLCSFDRFVEQVSAVSTESFVAVSLPLASRSELRDFIRGLTDARLLELHVPYCESEAIVKAQRGFSFSKIPEFEFRSFNKEPLPAILDGFDKVVIYKISQGD